MKEKNILIKIKERISTVKCEWICENCGELNRETYHTDDWDQKAVKCRYCNENFIGKLN